LHLGNHPNVVPIHYACQDSDFIFLAMPYFPNGSLKRRLTDSYLTVREIISIATQILSGLHNIHSKGLIHFDVKPDNILFSNRGEALLSDFGLAKQIDFSGVAEQDRLYAKMIPPECFNNNAFNRQFDIYQFGLTLHRMCTSEEQFYNEFNLFYENDTFNRQRFRHAVLNEQFPNRGAYPEHIPQSLVTTVRKCMSSDLDIRYNSAVDIVNDLADIDGNLLDWNFSKDPDSKSWTKTLSDSRQFQLSVNDDGSSHAQKTSASGNIQRVRSHCKNSLNRSDIKQFLRRY